jgi:hypothetical protein
MRPSTDLLNESREANTYHALSGCPMHPHNPYLVQRRIHFQQALGHQELGLRTQCGGNPCQRCARNGLNGTQPPPPHPKDPHPHPSHGTVHEAALQKKSMVVVAWWASSEASVHTSKSNTKWTSLDGSFTNLPKSHSAHRKRDTPQWRHTATHNSDARANRTGASVGGKGWPRADHRPCPVTASQRAEGRTCVRPEEELRGVGGGGSGCTKTA